MANKVLVITDLEGALVSSKAPEGRKYVTVMKNKWDKKVMAFENIQKLKDLDRLSDIVPMTKQDTKTCNSMAMCVKTPMSLVEAGAILLDGSQQNKSWKYDTYRETFDDYDLLHDGVKFITNEGYCRNGNGEFTIDCFLPEGSDRNIDADIEALKAVIGEKFNVIKAGQRRIYAYHKHLSRRAMVKKFIDSHHYDTVIAIAADNTGWLPEGYETISVEGNGAKYEFPRDAYEKDIHAFAGYAIDKAIEIASK